MSKQFAPNLTILDVGHGSAAVLRDTHGIIVFDAGKGPALLEFLREAGIKTVDRLVLSHADDDHIASAPTLLLADDIRVGQIFYNSDPTKDTDTQQQLALAIRTARRRRGTAAHSQLNTTLSGTLDCGEVVIEVLFPPPEELTTGVGGQSTRGKLNTSNSLSAAIRLSHQGKPIALLGGDVGQECLEFWDEEKVRPWAQILIFPHHGGAPSSANVSAFTERICTRVAPDVIIFSIHRTRFGLPRDDVITTILKVRPTAKLMCTQLPSRIADSLHREASGAWCLHRTRDCNSKKWWDGHIAILIKGGTGTISRYAYPSTQKARRSM